MFHGSEVKKDKILVIGGTGFLGYHISKYALIKGLDVASVSQKSPSNLRYLKNVKYILKDFTIRKEVAEILKEDYEYNVNNLAKLFIENSKRYDLDRESIFDNIISWTIE